MKTFGFLVVILALFLLLAMAQGLICSIRSPRHVREAHRRLQEIVKAVHRRELSTEEQAILDDAQRVGLVKTTLSHRKRNFYIRYHISSFGYNMALQGRYPTSDEIDEELKQFEVSSAPQA